MSVLLKAKKILQDRELDSISINNIPKPYEMKGIKEAGRILQDAILENKKIAIIGDYDTDGVCSAFIVESFLRKLGYFNFKVKIPNRFIDGYGININIVKELDCDIYISVDNGITAFDVANFIANQDKVLIIADHHKPLIQNGIEQLPNAIVINPSQESCNFLQKEVCGAMVSWYLCAGIKHTLKLDNKINNFNLDIRLDTFTAFVAIATIADMMPLCGLNRAFVKKGIKEIYKSEIPALIAIRNRTVINSQNLSFNIIPIINSAGRMEDANVVLDFFRSDNLCTATEIFNNLIKINNDRKEEQDKVLTLAKNNLLIKNNIAIAYGDNWHEGVLGIVAARLAKELGLSSFCLSNNNGILKGSGRASIGVNLVESIHACKDYLHTCGGHKGAVGLSLESGMIDKFIAKLDNSIVLDSNIEDNKLIEIKLDDINNDLICLLKSYEPYGIGNKELIFASKNVFISSIMPLKNPIHKELQLIQGNTKINAMLFNYNETCFLKHINCTYSISIHSKDPCLIIENLESI